MYTHSSSSLYQVRKLESDAATRRSDATTRKTISVKGFGHLGEGLSWSKWCATLFWLGFLVDLLFGEISLVRDTVLGY